MAEAIGKGITDAGKEAEVVYVSDASIEELKKAKAFALGCPAMGAEVNLKLNLKGVSIEPVLWKENSVLIYTYRRSHLEKELKQDGVSQLLDCYGYPDCQVENCLKHLKSRLYEYECFPHEIGVFLGYPLEDVKGFIEHKGKECKLRGLWKVYCNEQETKKLFEKLQKCTRVYLQVFETGRSISQMTVCA